MLPAAREMAKFCLIAHAGKIGKESKTKAMFFPDTKTLKRWRINRSNLACISDNSSSETCDVVTSVKHDKINLQKIYIDAPETQVLDISTEEHVPFASSFCYLGAEIDFLLDDTSEIRIRVNKANKAMGALKFIWSAKHVSLDSKIKLFFATPVNLALWNCETWAGNKNDLKILDGFYHKAIRRILGIRMKRACEEHVKNDQVRKWFGGVKPLSHVWRWRLLEHVGRSTRQTPSTLPRLCLSLHIDGKLERGRPFRTNKDATSRVLEC